MTNIIGLYLDEDLNEDIVREAKQLPNKLDQRKSALQRLVVIQTDEGNLVESIRQMLPQDERPENLAKYRGAARKQFRKHESGLIADYLVGAKNNQNGNAAKLLEPIIDKIATDTGSDFATLMAAITAENAA